ncbi:MAG: KpsF/GutQ family sugar-phosphate isomerase [Acidobacteriota bacterium]
MSTPPTSNPAPTEVSESLDVARKVLETEAKAILGLIPRLDGSFERALDLLHHCAGRVIVTGMGKSGIIAHKMAATFSSTGTPAIFLHAAEAVHGDLGVVQTGDVVVALSYSGETEELLRLLESIRRIGAKLIALTGHSTSTLSQAADVSLSCEVASEACPMNLAPTASTTATLALGDAMAMALAQRKGFREEHFAELHPGGRIGKKLMRVELLMTAGDRLPRVRRETLMLDVIHEITDKRLGMTCVVDDDGRLIGIVTDGDLRRHMTANSNLLLRNVAEIMTPRPITIERHVLAVEAMRVMEQRKITSIVVADTSGVVEGVVHLHDLW